MAKFSAAGFRIIGTAAVTQSFFSISNATGSSVVCTVRRLLVQMDATAVLTTFMPLIKASRSTGAIASGGTALAKCPFDTAASASSANIVVLNACAGDGSAATAITGTPGTIAWQQYAMRLHTAVGQVLAPDNNLLPALVDTSGYDFIIRAGESLIVQIVAAATTSNPTTNHYFVECVWDET